MALLMNDDAHVFQERVELAASGGGVPDAPMSAEAQEKMQQTMGSFK